MKQGEPEVLGDDTTNFDYNKANTVRRIIQTNAMRIYGNNPNLVLEWATGVGKSLAALKCVRSRGLTTSYWGYIICKEHGHMSNWVEDIKKHKMDDMLNFTQLFLYDSLHKHIDIEKAPDFIILDECHAITERRLDYLMEIADENTSIVMLSATIEDDKFEMLKVLCRGKIHTIKIDIATAIERGILPSPKVYVHMYELQHEDGSHTYKMLKGSVKKRVKVHCSYETWPVVYKNHEHVELHISCSEKEYYHIVTTQIAKAKSAYFASGGSWLKNKWVNLGSQRKRFMSETKTGRARELLKESFEESRFICFTGSKKQCEALGGKNFVHSSLKSKDVVGKKDAFNAQEIDKLFVVNMFRESVNLVKVEKGLIVQLDNKELSFIQMLGRVFRSEFPEMHIMVLKDTRDQKYYQNVMKGFDMKYITVINH